MYKNRQYPLQGLFVLPFGIIMPRRSCLSMREKVGIRNAFLLCKKRGQKCDQSIIESVFIRQEVSFGSNLERRNKIQAARYFIDNCRKKPYVPVEINVTIRRRIISEEMESRLLKFIKRKIKKQAEPGEQSIFSDGDRNNSKVNLVDLTFCKNNVIREIAVMGREVIRGLLALKVQLDQEKSWILEEFDTVSQEMPMDISFLEYKRREEYGLV